MNIEIIEVRGEIYITNNDHIIEYDWFIRGNEIHKCFRVHKTDIEFLTSIDSVYCGSNTFWNKEYCKKIILTTNKDLIANGVQKIDEESLEYLKLNKKLLPMDFYKLIKEDHLEELLLNPLNWAGETFSQLNK